VARDGPVDGWSSKLLRQRTREREREREKERVSERGGRERGDGTLSIS